MKSLTQPTKPTKITKSEYGGSDCEPSSWFVGEPKTVPNYEGLFSHSVYFQQGDSYHLVADNITHEGNARHIAAAPELLAALQAVIPYARNEAEGLESFRGEDEVADKQADEAWAAVERAEELLASLLARQAAA